VMTCDKESIIIAKRKQVLIQTKSLP